ncbi:MAG: hypothetical protein ACNA8W_15125, partial [Bradymonadaceae bacterium]
MHVASFQEPGSNRRQCSQIGRVLLEPGAGSLDAAFKVRVCGEELRRVLGPFGGALIDDGLLLDD